MWVFYSVAQELAVVVKKKTLPEDMDWQMLRL